MGVAVGALITGGFSYFQDNRRETREKGIESVTRARELKLAVRMLQSDLSSCIAAVATTLAHKEYYRLSPETVRFDSWEKYRSVLVPVVTVKEWFELNTAFDSVAMFKGMRDLSMTSGNVKIDDEEAKHLTDVHSEAKAALFLITRLLPAEASAA